MSAKREDLVHKPAASIPNDSNTFPSQTLGGVPFCRMENFALKALDARNGWHLRYVKDTYCRHDHIRREYGAVAFGVLSCNLVRLGHRLPFG